MPDERAEGGVPLREPAEGGGPEAEFIVGNPPFVGAKNLRNTFGDEYAGTKAPEMPESADFVLYWWHHPLSPVDRPFGGSALLLPTPSDKSSIGEDRAAS